MNRVLVGAGGHAKLVNEIASQINMRFDCFTDPLVKIFSNLEKAKEFDAFSSFFIGIGGATPNSLAIRLKLYDRYLENKYDSFNILSNHSYVSNSANLSNGILIAHHAIVQTGAHVAKNAIVNTGAIIEHDSFIGEGSHVGPGAIILGGAKIGKCCMIGAGAVILPSQIVPDNTLVRAITRF
ncbi:MAG: hypothetical protein H6849_04245 [Alphaproteobacteria bacterium]|nr:MAG: hypothetical protein H6849_04245 [Alphaproteobacteria bacterium]